MPNLNTRTSSVQKPSIFDQFRQHVAEIVADPALTSSTRRFTRQSAKQKASTNESTATMPTKSFIAETSMTTRGNEQSEIETLRAENLELKSQLARTNKELLKLKDQFRAKNTKLQRFNNIKSSVSEKFHSWQKKLDNHLKEFNKPNTSTEVLPIQANNIASASQRTSTRRKRKFPSQVADNLDEYDDVKTKSKEPTDSFRTKKSKIIPETPVSTQQGKKRLSSRKI